MINLTEKEIIKDWPFNWKELTPTVSVLCVAFNHEAFIAQALDSFLGQKTNFPFEIVVHDDASTDGTVRIIQEYEKKFPYIVKPFYELENQYSKNDGSFQRIINGLCCGTYCAFCECDDFWTSSDKLQKQVDFLEQNKEYIACAHNTLVIEMDQKKDRTMYPFSDKILSIDDLKERWHASSLMYRNGQAKEWPEFMIRSSAPGDVKFAAFLKTLGRVYRFGNVMSAYRHGTPGSWTKTHKKVLGSEFKNVENVIDFYNKFDEWTSQKYESVSRRINELNFSLLLRKGLIKKAKEEYSDLYRNLPLKRRIRYNIECVLRYLK